MSRVLFSHRIQSHDGQGIHVEALVAALRAEGHEVLVVGPGFYQPGRVGSESRLVDLVRRALPGWATELVELAYSLPAGLRLWRAGRRFRPDVLYERFNLFFLAGCWVAPLLRVPLLLEVNSSLAAERGEHGRLRLRGLAWWSQRAVLRAADRVFAVSGVLRQQLLDETPGLAPERVAVTHNGVDPEEFEGVASVLVPGMAPGTAPDAVTGASAGPVGGVVGFVGFVRAWHGLDAVIEGLPARPGVRLVVAGDGPAVPGLRVQAERLGVSGRVRFLGNVGRAEVPAVLRGLDVALQPRVVGYASPLKVFEYAAAGRAIVAPDQPNVREILEHGRTALLFDPERPGALWEATDALLAAPALRAELGAGAREDVCRRFTWRGNARLVAAEGERLRRL